MTGMSRLFSIVTGAAIGVWLFLQMAQPIISIGAAMITILLLEIPKSSAEKRQLRLIADSQTLRLQDAVAQIGRLDQHIQRQSQELGSAISEIERRDSVGAPEARKLIESQRATLQAQAKAMDEAKNLIQAQEKMLQQLEQRSEDARVRWEDMGETMERVLNIQAQQAEIAQQRLADESGRLTEAFAENSREMQRTMTDLLHRLALEPRTSNVSVQDSVLMGGNTRASTEETVRVVVGPHVKRPSRRTPDVPKVQLKARPLSDKSNDKWVNAFNEDLV
ncbi:MAG: hypothetical protein VX627_03120 [Candidatus Thermoplasmatota archaeon]|nr:hypothetical protein [Candidatus Thermoplasmatota archaeon]